MFDTQVTIVGNALNTPEWRRLESNRAMVAKFKIAATSRRYDREHGRWVDGASLRVRVNCWRRLAENVAGSVLSGDPLIVTGRMYTRDWIGDDGQRRVSYELDAVAVGHDLSRGQSRFTRQRPALGTSAVDDEPNGGSAPAQPAQPAAGPAADGAAPDRTPPAGAGGAPQRPGVAGDLDAASEALLLLREAGLIEADNDDNHDGDGDGVTGRGAAGGPDRDGRPDPAGGAARERGDGSGGPGPWPGAPDTAGSRRETPLVGVLAVTEPA